MYMCLPILLKSALHHRIWQMNLYSSLWSVISSKWIYIQVFALSYLVNESRFLHHIHIFTVISSEWICIQVFVLPYQVNGSWSIEVFCTVISGKWIWIYALCYPVYSFNESVSRSLNHLCTIIPGKWICIQVFALLQPVNESISRFLHCLIQLWDAHQNIESTPESYYALVSSNFIYWDSHSLWSVISVINPYAPKAPRKHEITCAFRTSCMQWYTKMY